jgi:hypothetical protein
VSHFAAVRESVSRNRQPRGNWRPPLTGAPKKLGGRGAVRVQPRQGFGSALNRSPELQVLLRFSFSWAQCPEGARGLSPGFPPWEPWASKRRALKGRKRGLDPGRSVQQNNVYASGNFKSAALAGRFGIILRLPRVETLG